jgi:hypothetical protein
MKSLFEKFFKREEPNYNYVIGEYKPSRGNAMSKPARQQYDHDIGSPLNSDEMEIDNLYQDN